MNKFTINKDYNKDAFKYLEKVQSLKHKHSRYNVEFIRTLISLEKFEQAFIFSKSLQTDQRSFFEADLLLGLNSFVKKDYINAEKYFIRLQGISRYNIFLKVLLAMF